MGLFNHRSNVLDVRGVANVLRLYSVGIPPKTGQVLIPLCVFLFSFFECVKKAVNLYGELIFRNGYVYAVKQYPNVRLVLYSVFRKYLTKLNFRFALLVVPKGIFEPAKPRAKPPRHPSSVGRGHIKLLAAHFAVAIYTVLSSLCLAFYTAKLSTLIGLFERVDGEGLSAYSAVYLNLASPGLGLTFWGAVYCLSPLHFVSGLLESFSARLTRQSRLQIVSVLIVAIKRAKQSVGRFFAAIQARIHKPIITRPTKFTEELFYG